MDTIAFRSVVTQYKAVLFDSFGVLKDYYGLIDGAKETIDFLNEQGIPYLVLTNDASRSPAELADALATAVFVMGVEVGLDFINQIEGIDCIIVDEANKLHTSSDLDLKIEK